MVDASISALGLTLLLYAAIYAAYLPLSKPTKDLKALEEVRYTKNGHKVSRTTSLHSSRLIRQAL
jgi:hypothetical protein